MILVFISFFIGYLVLRYQNNIKDLVGLNLSFWHIGSIFPAIGFFLVGFSIKTQLVEKKIENSYLKLLLFFSFLILLVTLNKNHGDGTDYFLSVDMSEQLYGNYLWFLINACSGIFFIFALMKTLNVQSKLLNFIGENSIIFYGLNGFNLYIFDSYVLNLGIFPKNNFWAVIFSISYVLISQFVYIPLAILFRKYAPVLVGKKNDQKLIYR